MAWELFRRSEGLTIDKMIGHVAEMLGHARHVFDGAMSALLAGAAPEAMVDDVFGTDKKINALEQAVRRELIVHIGVHGTSDITAALIVLMVSRKVERIGDNAKNIYDLATYGADLSDDPDIGELRGARDEVSQMMGDAAEVFRTEDRDRAQAFLERAWDRQKAYDELVAELVRTDEPGPNGVALALLYRYLKRIVANLEGVVAGVVQPLDLIDYGPTGDEDSET